MEPTQSAEQSRDHEDPTADDSGKLEERIQKKRQTDMVCPFYVDSQRLTTLLLEPLQQLPEPLLQPQP